MDHLLSAVNYQEHKWLICGGGWSGPRAPKWVLSVFLFSVSIRQLGCQRQDLKLELHNIQSHPLAEPNKILLPSLHIKLEIIKNCECNGQGRQQVCFPP